MKLTIKILFMFVISSLSIPVLAQSQCNWYGSNYPVCQNQSTDWGWENNQSCIGPQTCEANGGSTSSSGGPTPSPTPTKTPGISNGRYAIVSRLSGLALDVANQSSENGKMLQQWSYHHSANQQFDITYLNNGYYSIRPAHSGKSLDLWDWSTENGGEIGQFDYTGKDNQQWRIETVDGDYVNIISRHSGKALDVWESSTANGGSIRQYTFNNTQNQQFSLIQTKDMYPGAQGLSLVWADEFNYTGLPNEAYWGYEEGMVRNNEAQYYTVARSQNAWVADGVLTITAHRESYNGAAYTSASINTAGKADWTYGRFEMRAKIDTRSGNWPAFWMLGYGKWPENGEIDIMEYYQDKILANVAWKAQNTDAWSAAWDSASLSMSSLRNIYPGWENQFHIWTLDWDTNAIRLYVDGALINETLLSSVLNPDGSNPYINRSMYILLNLAIGGNNGGDPSGTSFPSKYIVDYVRVYQ